MLGTVIEGGMALDEPTAHGANSIENITIDHCFGWIGMDTIAIVSMDD